MRSYVVALALVASASPALAVIAQNFSQPQASPVTQSTNYTGAANTTLVNGPVVPGKVFDRFIQIWIENTDFATAATSPTFQKFASQGIQLNSFYALTHPSEPNYCAVAGGDFFGMHDDLFYAIPQNISTIVDLLEAKSISWATYQEDMPYDGFTGFNYTQPNYLNTSAPPYTYYYRKHNPLVLYDSVMNVTARGLRVRNFNDFALDANNNTLPQWMFITPNIVNDAHDTTIEFASEWLDFWLTPLLANPNFNTNRTLIELTFDESEDPTEGNRILTILLGGAVPSSMHGTNDTTYYTHYSALSTVENNWGLGSLGRGDTNKTLANVFDFVAKATNYTNMNVSTPVPQNQDSGIFPGPLNAGMYIPFAAPDMAAVGAGGGPVFVSPLLNQAVTPQSLPAPVNLTASGQLSPWNTDPGFDYSSGTLVIHPPPATTTNSTSGGTGGSGSTGAAVTTGAPSAVLLLALCAIAVFAL